MTFIVDTNIILFSITKSDFQTWFERHYQHPSNDFIVSVVTEGELRSLAIQRQWGKQKLTDLELSLQQFLIYPIKIQSVINAYAQIDAYSQGKLPARPLPGGMTSRNMGKNDPEVSGQALWIAATAHASQATLLTTDHDFNHLDGVFFPSERIDIRQYL